MSEKSFEEVKREMAEALKKLRTDFPDALYVSVAFEMNDYGTGIDCGFRVANTADYTRGKTLDDAFSNLPNPETKKQQRIAQLKDELAKLEAAS